MANSIHVKAPARICLFGDHQDYLGLPVIACAIDRYIYIKATPNKSQRFEFDLPDLGTSLSIPIKESPKELEARDYFRSSLSVLGREGIVPDKGYNITLHGDIPINAGISSSSALTVAWISFLLKAFGDINKYTAAELGHLAYLAESIEHNESGGRMDQYTSAVGGIVLIETDQDKTLKNLDVPLSTILISESGDNKDTLGGLAHLNSKAKEAIGILKEYDQSYSVKRAKSSQVKLHASMLPSYLHPIYEAAINNHEITKKVIDLVLSNQANHQGIGDLMYKHHSLLRDLLKITTPKIDSIVQTAMDLGAFGAKIIGSGGGGCVVILCDDTNKEGILAALNDRVGAKTYQVHISEGAHQLNL
ncbi:MAG: galactokinase family protein [Gilvibacter sp.]